MKHHELSREFSRLKLKVGDRVRLILKNEKMVIGELASKIYVEKGTNGGYISSTSYILLYPDITGDNQTGIRLDTPYYAKDILGISKIIH
jgi:hypothetical protein